MVLEDAMNYIIYTYDAWKLKHKKLHTLQCYPLYHFLFSHVISILKYLM